MVASPYHGGAQEKCMMEEELSLLKKSLISLVVSSPTTMTVSRLLKDYRSLVGGALPLAKYGYREPILFLRERCTDIFVMEGPSWDPILTPKVTKNLAHIDQMVQKQKVQSTLKHKGKRRSVFQPTPPVPVRPQSKSDAPNRYDTTIKYNRPPDVREKNTNTQIKFTEPKISQDTNNYNSKHTDNNYVNNHDSSHHESKAKQSISDNNKNEINNITSNSIEESCPSSALSKFYKKRLPQYFSDMDFPSADAEHTSKGSAESGRQSSASSTSKQALLDDLKAEIVTLINDSAEGVWCDDLIRLYKERYGRELKFNMFGHTSIISLVYSIEDRVAISRPTPNGDWLLQMWEWSGVMLQDPSGVGCAGGAGGARGARGVRGARYVSTRALPADDDDALPGVDFEPDVFPSDCLHYMDAIPAQPLEALEGGAQLEVLVGEVYSPSHFWMLRVGPRHNLAMEQIMDEMTEYYRGEGASRVLARGAIRVGQYCASLYDNDWHRSLIVSLIDSDTVKVRHVDYGTVDTVSVSALKPLLRGWGALPAQAVRARLAGCRPPAAGWRWPRAACAWFLQRVQDTRLYTNVLAVDREEDIVETFLIDTTGAEDACLTRDLIRVGHADRRKDSALKSSDRYLYPRFASLECGDTPNYADICRMLADGIALEYVEAYRRHVPGPWAPQQPEAPPAPTPSPPPSPPPTPPPSPPTASPAASELPQPLELLNRIPLLHLDARATPPPPRLPRPATEHPPWRAPPARFPAAAYRPRPPPAPPVARYRFAAPPPPPLSSYMAPPPGLAPPPRPGPGALEVRLSEAEWAVLSHLRGADPGAAHWYLLTQAWRAMLLPPAPPGL